MSQIAVFSRFVRIVACSRILSELSVIPVCGHRLLCSLSSVGGHLGYFQLLPIVNNAARAWLYRGLFESVSVFSSCGCIPKIGIAGS